MFSTEDLRDLSKHLIEKARDLERAEDKERVIKLSAPSHLGELPVDPVQQMKKFARQIEVIGYSPLLLEDLMTEYDLKIGSLQVPLEDTPLHLHDAGALSQVIVKWRLSRGV